MNTDNEFGVTVAVFPGMMWPCCGHASRPEPFVFFPMIICMYIYAAGSYDIHNGTVVLIEGENIKKCVRKNLQSK